MPEVTGLLPCRRTELVVSPFGDRGGYVVKNLPAGMYYHLGEEEHFLLTQLDGRHDAGAFRAAFAARFGQPLSEEELDEFLADRLPVEIVSKLAGAHVDVTSAPDTTTRTQLGVVHRSGHRGDTESWADKTPPCLGWARWA